MMIDDDNDVDDYEGDDNDNDDDDYIDNNDNVMMIKKDKNHDFDIIENACYRHQQQFPIPLNGPQSVE